MRRATHEREDSARSSSETVSTPSNKERRRSSAKSNHLSAELVLEAIAKDDQAFIDMGKEEETRRHREIQKALVRHEVELNQLNLRELDLSGREKEMSVLMKAYHEVCTPSKHNKIRIVNVKGKAGTGKTRLCQELRRRVRSKKGFFLTGKFDLQNRQEAYAGISMALADVPAQFLELGDDARTAIQDRLKEAIGEEGMLLASLAPNLSQLLPKPAGAGLTEGTSAIDDNYATRSVRLLVAVQQFLGALCIPNHAVVMFLDDMQWSDEPSLSLISSLATTSALSSLLLVTTCREEEVDESSPFIKHLNEILDKSLPHAGLLTMDLSPLDQESVYSIVSTALRSSDENTFKLSEIVHHKSNGNPMYVIQFLIGLLEDEVLRYNIGLMSWTYDELRVRSRFVTDNVAELAVKRLQRLEARLQKVLMTAACLGQTFDLSILELVLLEPKIRLLLSRCSDADDCENVQPEGDSSSNLSEALGSLVQETVIDYIKPLNAYCFMHDLIQAAAFDLIPPASRVEVQCEVGRCLLRREGSTALDDKCYFRAVDLSNTGSSSLSEEEKVGLAYTNERAGRKAMAKAGFAAALKYFEAGLSLLGPVAWTKEPQLAMELSTGAVEASFCCGDFDIMETRVSSLLDRDPPIENKIRVSIARISSNGVQFRHELSLEIGRRLLKEMKITNLPSHPRLHHLVIEFLKTKRVLKGRTAESLSELPLMKNKRWLRAMSVADVLDPVANSNVFFFVVLKLRSLQWTLEHGVCSCSPSIFAAYALLLCATGDVARAQEIGSAAIKLSERLQARSTLAKTLLLVYGFVNHWTASLRIVFKPLLYAHKVGMQTGEIENAVHCLLNHDFALLATSATPLTNLVDRLRVSGKLMQDFGHEGIHVLSAMTLQFALNLSVTTDNPSELSGDAIEDTDIAARFNRATNALMFGFLDHYRLLLAFYFEDYDNADRICQSAENLPNVVPSHFFIPINALFRGLTNLAMARRCAGRRRLVRMRRSAKITHQMKKWVDNGNVNCIHMLQLLQAEAAAVQNREREAKEMYVTAISTAAKNGYLNDKALAHELAFRFHLRCQGPEDPFWAQNHYKDAVQAYCDWNACQKARHLLNTYGHHFSAVRTALSECPGGTQAN